MLDTIKVLFILTGASTYLVTKNESNITTFMNNNNQNDKNDDNNNGDNNNTAADNDELLMMILNSSINQYIDNDDNQSLLNLLIMNNNQNINQKKLNVIMINNNDGDNLINTTRLKESKNILWSLPLTTLSNCSSSINCTSIEQLNQSYKQLLKNETISIDENLLWKKMKKSNDLNDDNDDNDIDDDDYNLNDLNYYYYFNDMNDQNNQYNRLRAVKDVIINNYNGKRKKLPKDNLSTTNVITKKSKCNKFLINNSIHNQLLLNDESYNTFNDKETNDINNKTKEIKLKQPIYEIIINEEDNDLPKKLFQIKALMISKNNNDTKKYLNEKKFINNQKLMFILNGNGIDYEHPENSKFAINTMTGELYLIKKLDRDPPDGQEQYRLLIQMEYDDDDDDLNVNNKLNGNVTVIVRVKDINDNEPYFEQREYFTQVKENLASGVDIIRMNAIDLDPDSIIRYSIEMNRVNSDGELIFDIDELSGLLSTAVCCLDRESIQQYQIKICATDHTINGNDHQDQKNIHQHQRHQNYSSCTNVYINVTDDNDEIPKFIRQQFHQTIQINDLNNDLKNLILLNTTIIDKDLPETNHFICRLEFSIKFSFNLTQFDELLRNQTSNKTSTKWNNLIKCKITRVGYLRVHLTEKWKFLKKLLRNEYKTFKKNFFNQFNQNIKFNNYVDIIINIYVSDLGYFEMPKNLQQANLQVNNKQQQLRSDLSGLLDTHVISAQLTLKLIFNTDVYQDLFINSVIDDLNINDDDDDDDDDEFIDDDKIINKQRIDQTSMMMINLNNLNNNLTKTNEIAKINENLNLNGRMNKFFQKFIDHFISKDAEMSTKNFYLKNFIKSFLFLLIFVILIVILIIIIIVIKKRKKSIVVMKLKRKLFQNQPVDEQTDDTDGMIPILLTTTAPQTLTSTTKTNEMILYDDHPQTTYSLNQQQRQLLNDDYITGTTTAATTSTTTTTSPFSITTNEFPTPHHPYELYDLAQFTTTNAQSHHHSHHLHQQHQQQQELIEMQSIIMNNSNNYNDQNYFIN